MNKTQVFAVIGAVAAGLLIAVFFILFEVAQIAGNELGVHETWADGVLDDPMQPKTYFLFPGFLHTVYVYDMSSQVYVMNDKPSRVEFAAGREQDAYTVQSKEAQFGFALRKS